MNDIQIAKAVLIAFMEAMFLWERKATKSLRSKEDNEVLKAELSAIFQQFCTPKKTPRNREISLSVRFPFEYKFATHPITDQTQDEKYLFFYVKENNAGLETTYRYKMANIHGKWLVDKKECLNNGVWKNHYL